MKKLFIGLGLIVGVTLSQAQTGTLLDGIVIEKVHTATAADHQADVTAAVASPIAVGAVTYRIWVDMKSDVKFATLYGDNNHALTFSTTTSFYNNNKKAAALATEIDITAQTATSIYDSWLTLGANSSTTVAVYGGADIEVTPAEITNLGITTLNATFKTSNAVGGVNFSTYGGAITTTNGENGSGEAYTPGHGAENMILIGQITTDGIFSYELNFQLTDGISVSENYVASSPNAGEYTMPGMSATIQANVPPTVAITAPANGTNVTVGDVVNITATATDLIGLNGSVGSVTKVDFYDGGTLILSDATSPYEASITATAGSHVLTAVATDNNGESTTSASVTVSAGANVGPVFQTLTALPATVEVGDAVTLTATATDGDGVASIAFKVDGTTVFTATNSPYTYTYIATSAGIKNVTAIATDARVPAASTTSSSAVTFTVNANPAPVVSAVTVTGVRKINNPLTLSVTATDNSGTISSVKFYNGTTLIGTSADVASPYSLSWTPTTEGSVSITAVAADGKLVTTTSSANVFYVNGDQAYKIKDETAACSDGDFIYVIVQSLTTVTKAIGFDFSMEFNKNKVRPTGNVKVFSNLVTDSLNTTYAINVKDTNVIIGLSLNALAQTPYFNGTGDLLAVEFVKTAGFSSIDSASFSISSGIDVSYDTTTVTNKTTGPGTFKTYQNHDFIGSLKFWSDYSPIGFTNALTNLETKIKGNDNDQTVYPNANGIFTYDIRNGDSINIIRQVVNGNSVQDVVNAADALLAQKVVVENTSFIPSAQQIIAMDVNMDGRITSGDVTQINQRTVNHIGEFGQVWNASGSKNSLDWLFVDQDKITLDSSYRISNKYPQDDNKGFSKWRVPVQDSLINLNIALTGGCQIFDGKTFQGIMLGDVNGSYKNIPASPTLKSAAVSEENVSELKSADASSDKVIFDLANATTANGLIDVPVYISSTSDVTGLDFALQMKDLTFDKVVSNTATLQNPTSYFNTNDQTLRFTGFDFAPISTKSSVVTVRFAMANNAVTATDLTATEAYLNGEKVNAEVTPFNGSIFDNNTTLVVDVYPNPTSNILNLKVSQAASVQIFDVLGKVVIEIPSLLANEIKVLNIQDMSEGVYTLKVVNEKATTIVKVVKNK